jgi:hypothetical protein
MKSTYLGLCACLLSLAYLTPGLGQSRWAVSINLAPIYACADYKRVLPFPSVNLPGPTATELISKTHSWGYLLGLMGQYRFSANWSASAGIWATQINTSKGTFTTDGYPVAVSYSNTHPFNYAYQVPLMVNYQSANKRLSPYVSAGVSANFRATSYYNLSGGEIAIKLGPPVIFTPILGIGAIYHLNEQVSLVLQPMIQYDVRVRPTYVYYHSFPISLQTQLIYRF